MSGQDITKENMRVGRRILKNATYLLIGSIIADSSGFIFRVLIAQEFGPREFGIFSLSLMTISLATSVSILGLPDGVVTFVSKFRTNDQGGKITGVITLSIISTVPISVVMTFGVWFFAGQISNTIFSSPQLMPALRILSLAIPAKSAIALSGALCLSYERAGLKTAVQKVFPKIGIIITAALIIFVDGDFYSLLKWYVIVLWVIAAIAVLISYKLVRIDLSSNIKTEPIKLLTYSFPLFLSGVVGLLLNWIDTVAVGYFLGSANVGIYQSAYLLGTTIALIQNVIAGSLYPNFGTLLAEEQLQTLRDRYQWGVSSIAILTMAPAMYLVFFPQQSLLVIFGDSYTEASVALAIVVIGQYISVSIGPATVLLKTLESTNHILITITGAVLLNGIFNLVLIPIVGISGAAIATGASSALLNISHFWGARKQVSIKLPTRDIAKAGIAAGSVSIILKLGVGKVTDPFLFVAHIACFSLLYSLSVIGTNIYNYNNIRQILFD